VISAEYTRAGKASGSFKNLQRQGDRVMADNDNGGDGGDGGDATGGNGGNGGSNGDGGDGGDATGGNGGNGGDNGDGGDGGDATGGNGGNGGDKSQYYKLWVDGDKTEEGGKLDFYIRLDNPADHKFKVWYETDGGTAKEDKDYDGKEGWVEFHKHDTYAKVTIQTNDDHYKEDAEYFKFHVKENDSHVETIESYDKGWIYDNDHNHHDGDHHDDPWS
jgi:hypothetical protein